VQGFWRTSWTLRVILCGGERVPIDVVQVSDIEASNILKLTEGHFVDHKDRRIAPGKLTKHISAFANADGGELFIGITEQNTTPRTYAWSGFYNVEEANAHIQVLESLFPLGSDFRYEFLKPDTLPGIVLRIEVRKTRDVVKTQDGSIYVRRGAQSLAVTTADRLETLRRVKGLTSFETEPVNADYHYITNSEPVIELMLSIVPHAEPEEWLRKQQMIIDDKPTVGGIVLFADEPQAILPKRTSVKIYRYKTRAEGSRETLAFDPITIEGHLYKLITEAVQKTIEVIQAIPRLGGEGLESISYPRETIHEIVTNALLHRDYYDTNDTRIRIFDNRIEVESPGRLPAHITPENILRERFARNAGIVRMINKFPDPPNKDVGEGLRTAIEAMKNLRLKPPEIIERENSVVVYIRHEPLASPEELIMEHVREKGSINNSTARNICHIGSENEMKRIFQRLMRNGQIERVPGLNGPLSAYRLTPSQRASGEQLIMSRDDDEPHA
jgi:ATP-dependent DNA helicase RecG